VRGAIDAVPTSIDSPAGSSPTSEREEVAASANIFMGGATATVPGAIAISLALERQRPLPLPEPFSQESVLGLLPNQNPCFTGRITALAEIERSLSRAQQGIITQSVVGLGGVGKTQLVTEYVYQSIEMKRYGYIVWLDGRNPLEAYQDLGKAFHLQFESNDSESQCITKVERLLKSHNASLLLVWDDATDQAQMLPYLASAARLKAHCLITSRAQYFGGARTNLAVIRLDVFNEMEALDYIQKRCILYPGLFEEASAKVLAKTLHYLPLALSQAVAYIVSRREQDGVYNYAISDYIKEYQQAIKHKLKKFYETSSDDEYQETVWTTWYLSINALSSAGKKQAIDLLEHCAYFDGNAMTDEFLSLVTNITTDETTDNIRALLSYSLIERLQGSSHPSIKIHQLVQTVIRLHLHEEPLPLDIPLSFPQLDDLTQEEDPVPETLLMRRYLTDNASQWQWDQRERTFHFPLSNPPPSSEELEAARAQKENPATALRRLVIPGSHNARHHQMIALLLKQLQKSFHFDERHMEQLRAVHILFAPHVEAVCNHALKAEVGESDAVGLLFRLGELIHYLKDAKKRQEIFQIILPYYEHFHSNHPLHAQALDHLAIAYGDLGDPQEQKRLLQCALRIKEHNYGIEHVEVACTLNNLANAYGALGDPQEKKRLLQRALVIQERYYGPEHVEVASTLNNLANAYAALGDPQEQKRLLQRALEIKERHYGPEHGQVASTLNNLANAYGALGDPQEKKRLLQRALEIQERYYGPEHVGVASTLNNLANAYAALGNYQEQKRLLQRALEIKERHYGPEHVEVAHTLGDLATAYGDLGDPQEQKRLVQRALVIKERYYGPEHVEVGHTLNNLSNVYGALRDHQEQKRLLERALVIQERYYGPEHVEVASTLGNLANAYGALGDPQEQKRLVQRALVIEERYYGPEHVEVASTLNNLATAYGALGDPQEQKRLVQRALMIFEHYYGPEHGQVAITLNNLANAYGDLGDPQEQKRLLQRALEIQERYYGAEHVEVASTLNNLATAYGDLGDRQEQKRLLQRTLVIKEGYYGAEHVEVASTLNNLATAYGALGDPQEQKRLVQRALVIQERYYGPEHVEMAGTLGNLANAYGALGELPSAQNSYHRALRIQQPFFGEAHPEVGRIFFNLSVLHFRQKEFSLSLVYLKQAHAIFLHHPNCGPTHPYTQKAIEALNQLAPHLSIWEAQMLRYTHSQRIGNQALQNKDYPTAIQHWQVALPFVTAQSFLSPARKLDAILLYERLGDAYREQGEWDKALANFTQAQIQLTYLTLQQSDDYLRITSKKSVCDIKLAATLAHQRG
jgi:tetratricopeptide (TPR) repeat protein